MDDMDDEAKINAEEESESDDMDDDRDSEDSEPESNDSGEEQSTESPFHRILKSAWDEVRRDTEVNGESSKETQKSMIQKVRKAFREKYLDTLLWLRDLRKDPTHQSVMETAKLLRNDMDFDQAESVEAAISKRKFLLNRFVPSDAEDASDNEQDQTH
jgi:hypothetical protein